MRRAQLREPSATISWHYDYQRSRRPQCRSGGDGQVSLGDTVMKGNAVKVRKLYQDKVLRDLPGTADAFTLFEKFEAALEKYHGQLTRCSRTCKRMAI